jgi:hypothetical protein
MAVGAQQVLHFIENAGDPHRPKLVLERALDVGGKPAALGKAPGLPAKQVVQSALPIVGA